MGHGLTNLYSTLEFSFGFVEMGHPFETQRVGRGEYVDLGLRFLESYFRVYMHVSKFSVYMKFLNSGVAVSFGIVNGWALI